MIHAPDALHDELRAGHPRVHHQLVPCRDDAATFRSDDDLLTILDSLQILRMLIDLEAQFSIKVDNSELSPENLGTVEKLAAFVARKQTESVG